MTVSEQPPTSGAISASALLGGRSGGLGWWWHTTEDTLDKLDPQFLARDARLYAATIYRLCAEAFLPFDYAAAAYELDTQIRHYAELVADRFDLGELQTRSAALCDAAGTLHADLEALRRRSFAGEDAQVDAADLNRALMQLGRTTIPLNYTVAGPFGHDPALALPPLPLLAAAA
ncbi:MAG: hypothetical protein HC822_22640, partial [Oscillochloris sp.]|nr:hypothetical protein [Oscillochloris sp.]